MALDAFLNMFPPSFVEIPDGFAETPPEIAIYLGPLAQRLISGYHHALAACALAGNHLTDRPRHHFIHSALTKPIYAYKLCWYVFGGRYEQ